MTKNPALWSALALTIGALSVAPGPAEAASGDEMSERAQELAARYYDKGVRRTRVGDAKSAIEFFEKALPQRNQSSDIFFNLVQVSEAARKWRRVLLYAQGFLSIEPHGADAVQVRASFEKARRLLSARSAGPVEIDPALSPEGAWVWVDHTPVGVTGGAPIILMPGRYQVVVKRRDYLDWSQRVTIPPTKRFTLEGEMKALSYEGRLAIQTDPPEGVEVFIDERPVGTTPLEPVTLTADQRVLVRFAKPGYDRWVRYVVVPRDDTLTLSPKLETMEQALRMR